MSTPVSDSPSLTSNATQRKEATPLSQFDVPDEPLVTIQAKKSWSALDLHELWLYRELLYFLTLRDIKVRYKQTLLGVSWVLLQPLLTTIVFTIFLGVLLQVPSEGTPYVLFVYAGLLLWTFFSAAVISSSNSLVTSAHLITKVYFPRAILPVSAVGARLLDLAIAFLVLICLMAYYRVGLTWAILLLPVLVALITLLAVGVGMVTSAINVKYRDVGVLIPVLLQLWMYASPVVYPASLVPTRWQRLYELNPLVGLIGNFRAAALGGPINWIALAWSVGIIVGLLVYAAFLFRRMETHFADIV
ncbi:MAG TPA: ABC transporter permease [Pyrinomonadaceae bacterium]|jgi:lipopolysaccharide transport system permease protein|nr:ABC transporter permease [Pyrinomonadaceae bacterium]